MKWPDERARSQRVATRIEVCRGLASTLMVCVLLGALDLSSPEFANAFTAEEHFDLANRIWPEVLDEIGANRLENEIRLPLGDGFLPIPRDVHEGGDWPDAVRAFAKQDRDASRFHRYLESTQQQLSRVLSNDLRGLAAERVGARRSPSPAEVEAPAVGTVANFFLHHWLALQFAEQAASHIDSPNEASKAMQDALVYEAMAQGYLVDAFSASHMLVPDRNWLSWLHPHNTKLAHDKRRASGTYVIDSLHRVWLCYGDRLLFWYPLALERVCAAAQCSLREVLASFYMGIEPQRAPLSLREWLQDQYPEGNGWEMVEAWLEPSDASTYYAELRMPSLLSMPMPVAATWSVQSEEEIQPTGVEPAIHARLHYPQLADAGLHDPTLSEDDRSELYFRNEVPDWMVLPALSHGNLEAIESVREVASVRWQCERHLRPPFLGGVFAPGVGHRVHPEADAWVGSLGVGYGILDDEVAVPWIPNILRLSLEARWDAGFHVGGGALTGVIATQSWFPTRADLHTEFGYAVAIEEPLRRHGPTIGLGLTLDTFELPPAYLASLIRLRWELLYLDEITGGPVLEFVIY